MQLLLITVFVGTLSLTAGKKLPVSDRQVHHSTKKQLRPDVVRLPRGNANEEVEGSDLDPAMAYALPPSALLHQGHGFGYGLGQGPEAAALAALVSSGLHHEGRQVLAHVQRPVYHYSPLEQHALFAHSSNTKPIEEPKQEEPAQVVHDVHAQAHSFVDPANLYKQESHEDEYKDYAAKYQFGYRVRDQHTGSDFGQTESRDGHMTQGQYHVLLPDGRLQNVQYWSDHSGFHAKVTYDGQAHHMH